MEHTTLLIGADPTQRMRASDNLVRTIAASMGHEPDITSYNGQELTPDNLPDMYSLNMFGTPQLLVIQGVDLMSVPARDLLMERIKGGGLSVSLLMTASKIKPVTKLSNAIKKLDPKQVITLELPKDTDDKGWKTLIADEFVRCELNATKGAVDAFFMATGTQYAKMVSTMQLLVTDLPDEVKARPLTEDDILEHVRTHGSRGAFAISDAVMQRDTEKALRLARGAIENGDSPIAILGALNYAIKQMIALTTRRPASQTGFAMPPFAARKAADNKQRFGPGELTVALNHLTEADFAAKSGGMDAALALERCIIGITTPGMPAPVSDSIYLA